METKITEQEIVEVKAVEPKKVNYLNDKDMLRELKLSHEKGQMTDELCRMFMKLTERYAKKGCFHLTHIMMKCRQLQWLI